MRVDGSRRMRLTRGARDADAAWSSDGETIFFSRVVEGEYYEPCRAVLRIGKDGRGLRRLTRTIPGGRPDGELNPIDAPRDLTVSPDGLRVAFTDKRTCETTDTLPNLEVIDRSGQLTGDLSRLPESAYERGYANPSWSPDGARIAFGGFTRPGGGGVYERVYVANRDGSGLRPVTPRQSRRKPGVVARRGLDRFRGEGRHLRDPSRRHGAARAHKNQGARTFPRMAAADANRVTVDPPPARRSLVSRRITSSSAELAARRREPLPTGCAAPAAIIGNDGGARIAQAEPREPSRHEYRRLTRTIAVLTVLLVTASGVGCSGASSHDVSEGRIAFAVEVDGDYWRLVTANADGSGNLTVLRHLSEVLGDETKWSPDGQKIASTDGDGFWVINADGTGLRDGLSPVTPPKPASRGRLTAAS